MNLIKKIKAFLKPKSKQKVDYSDFNASYGSLFLYEQYAKRYFATLKIGSYLPKKDVYLTYLKLYSVSCDIVTQIRFNKWLKIYSDQHQLKLIQGRNRVNGILERWHKLEAI